MLSSVFKPFVEKSPISVMARAMIERALNPEQLDQWFDATAKAQYTRDLLFSSLFGIMSQVVSGRRRSVNAAYQGSEEQIGVSITSIYNKLNGIEAHTSAELVRYASGQLAPIIKELGGIEVPLLVGFRTKVLDGNCIEASEHRIKQLRGIAAGALPGKSLVVYDPQLATPIDVYPCEDGHTQERALLSDVLPSVKPDDLWLADRNFCVRSFLCGISDRKAYFAIRQHGNLPWEPLGKEIAKGRTDTGKVFEQPIRVLDEHGKAYEFRRIRVLLNEKTRDGDKEIFIITSLSKSAANARTVADLYLKRWTIETSFQQLKSYFNSEINTLGYPPAALFAFCIALIAYMILSVIMAALGNIHGHEKIKKEVSGYYISNELSETYAGMMIAAPPEEWKVFLQLSQREMIKFLKRLAENAKLSKYKKHPRGPKKPAPKRVRDPKTPHVSTARLIAGRKK
jgi:hypothetical protein